MLKTAAEPLTEQAADCTRCGGPGVTRTRGETMCSPCFQDFINIRVRKHLDRFRVNFLVPGIPRLVVAVSFGPSSLALVAQLRSLQLHQRAKYGGRVGFALECVYVGDIQPPWPAKFVDVPLKRLDKARTLAQSVTLDGLSLTEDALASLSRTSRQDLNTVLIRRTVTEYARTSNASAVVWGSCMSRLAELALSETAKGRGAALPEFYFNSANVDQNSTDLRHFYPLRDLLSSEVSTYLRLEELPHDLIAAEAIPGVARLQSVDEIVQKYLVGVQSEFPGVISTLTRTVSKLSQDSESCSVCKGGSGICYACAVTATNRSGKSQELSVAMTLAEYEL